MDHEWETQQSVPSDGFPKPVYENDPFVNAPEGKEPIVFKIGGTKSDKGLMAYLSLLKNISAPTPQAKETNNPHETPQQLERCVQ